MHGSGIIKARKHCNTVKPGSQSLKNKRIHGFGFQRVTKPYKMHGSGIITVQCMVLALSKLENIVNYLYGFGFHKATNPYKIQWFWLYQSPKELVNPPISQTSLPVSQYQSSIQPISAASIPDC